ncbi:MAG: sugar ABC transporter ATP-binding protein [Polyangiaceae bacterium]
MTAPRLRFSNVKKSFGATKALRGVTFEASAGEIHAIVGENGAGKSTLMNVLAGAIAPDGGEVEIDGVAHRPSGPLAAREAGVAMVHQELSLCPHLTVAENIFLGMEPSRFGVVDRQAMIAGAEKALSEVMPEGAAEGHETGLHAQAIVGELPPSARQLVEIARALAHPSCKVLVLDEPTSSLSARESLRLFEGMKRLAGRGLTVLFISHFLEEVLSVADRYTVLRDGESVGSGETASVTVESLVEKMAGRRGEEVYPARAERAVGEVVLSLANVAGAVRPKEATLELRRGEILGLFGLVGSGRTELLRAVFGLDPVVRGEVRVGAYQGPSSPGQRLSQGVGLLSEDRAGEGVALSLSIADNVTMSAAGRLVRYGLLWPAAQLREASRWVDRLGIKTRSPEAEVGSLSGGNQQKVALGRLLSRDVDVLLLDEPTRGIDVTSKAQIYRLLSELAGKGKAILMVSSYLPELLGVCDRLAIMSRGALGPLREVAGLREEDVLREATGA